MDTPTLPLWIAIECLALGLLHYIPFIRRWLGSLNNPVRLIFNYTSGTACIGGMFVGWLRKDLPQDPHQIAVTFCFFVAMGGFTVVLAYFIDWLDSQSMNRKTQTTIDTHLEQNARE